MITASLMGFVRTILIILAIYFVMKILGRLLMPWLARKAGEKMKDKMEEEMRRRTGQPRQDSHRKEGEVTIEYTDKSKKRNSSSSNNVGEYVDYEEVD